MNLAPGRINFESRPYQLPMSSHHHILSREYNPFLTSMNLDPRIQSIGYLESKGVNLRTVKPIIFLICACKNGKRKKDIR